MSCGELLGAATIPGGGEMTLHREEGQFLIKVEGSRLMTSSLHVSEERLAFEALSRIQGKRVLIGGLGMGFTLRSALDSLPEDSEVTVAELVEEVVEWNRLHLGKLAHHPLRDPRVRVYLGDVAALFTEEESWDAILLDVDNGAIAFTREGNRELYEDNGLSTLLRSLSPDGILAVWSTSPNRKFEKRLRRANFRTETVRVEETRGRSRFYHYLFLASPNRNAELTATDSSRGRVSY